MDIGHAALASHGTMSAEEPRSGTAYEDLYPYHAELCALSELRKKPGFGVPLRSGIGGHSLLYLNGVRLDRAQATRRSGSARRMRRQNGMASASASIRITGTPTGWPRRGEIFCGAARWHPASG